MKQKGTLLSLHFSLKTRSLCSLFHPGRNLPVSDFFVHQGFKKHMTEKLIILFYFSPGFTAWPQPVPFPGRRRR